MKMRTGRATVGSVVLWLGCAIIFVGAIAGQAENTASAVGVEAIKRVLTGHKQWTLCWDRASGVRRPRLGPTTSDRSPSATLEFMRAGSNVIGHAQDDQVHPVECEFKVTVRENGFTFAGCVGSDKTMTYDPDDREYPFKGRTDGTLLWLAPSK